MTIAEVPKSNGGYLVPLAYNTKNNSVLVPPEGFKPPNHLIRSEACYSVTLRGHRCWNPVKPALSPFFPSPINWISDRWISGWRLVAVREI